MICGRYRDVRCTDNSDNIHSAPIARKNEGDPGRGTSALCAEPSLPAISEGFEGNTSSTNWPSCIKFSWTKVTDWLVLKHSVRFPSLHLCLQICEFRSIIVKYSTTLTVHIKKGQIKPSRFSPFFSENKVISEALIYLFISKFIRHASTSTISFSKIYYIVSRKRLKGLSLVLAGS